MNEVLIEIDERNSITLRKFENTLSVALHYKHPTRKSISRANIMLTKEQALDLSDSIRAKAEEIPNAGGENRGNDSE